MGESGPGQSAAQQTAPVELHPASSCRTEEH